MLRDIDIVAIRVSKLLQVRQESGTELFGLYSVIFPVAVSTLAILPAPASANQMLPRGSEVTPAGLASGVGMS